MEINAIKYVAAYADGISAICLFLMDIIHPQAAALRVLRHPPCRGQQQRPGIAGSALFRKASRYRKVWLKLMKDLKNV